MKERYLVKMPTHITLSMVRVPDKKISLSLNWYRNAHHQQSNRVKKRYCQLAGRQIKKLPEMDVVELEFIYYSQKGKPTDIDNWCSVSNKFFQDCLVYHGKIKEDNYKFIKKIMYTYGGPSETGKGYINIFIEGMNGQ